MKPQKAIRLVNKEMKKFYKISVIDYPDLSSLKCFLKRDVYKALKQLERKCELMELDSFYEEGGDKNYRIEPMYQDAISVRDILSTMHHISDRWSCAGRIKFVLRVLEDMEVEEAIPKVEEVLLELDQRLEK